MTTIFIKDDLRQSVESATGGKVTVLYSSSGLPGYYHVVPKFNKQDIDAGLGSGVHPAFIVNGVEKSEVFIGQFQASVKDNMALSLPGQIPAVYTNFDQARTYCANLGPGFHLMTNAEWTALALWCWKNGYQPRGNSNWGQSSDATYETGRRGDKGTPGTATGDGKTLTGSGPVSWRHNNDVSGIADLNGNVWEWVGGMRLNAGEIQIIQDNNAADNTKDQSAGSALWKAINGADGTLIAPGDANSIKYGASGTTNYTLVRASGALFEGMTNPGGTPVGAAALQLAKSLGLYPVAATGLGGDGFWIDVTSERLPLRGGGWGNAAMDGVFALDLGNARSYSSSTSGFRPAFVA